MNNILKKFAKNCCYVCAFVSILLSMCSCDASASQGTTSDSSEQVDAVLSESTTIDFDIESYKSLVSSCHESIMSECILLSNAGKYQYNYWETLEGINGTINYESMYSSAVDWLLEQDSVDSISFEENHLKISEAYKEIISIDVSGAGAEEIQNNFIELFSSYDHLYLLITSPSGSIDDFADSFNDYSTKITNCDSLLVTLLDE